MTAIRPGALWRRWRKPGTAPSLLPHPMTVVLFIASLVGGLSILIGGPIPGSIDQQLSPTVVICWAALLALGSFVSIIGVIWHGSLAIALTLERLGGIALVPAVALYVGAAFYTLGSGAITTPVLIVGAYGVGVALRMCQIERFSRHLHRIATR